MIVDLNNLVYNRDISDNYSLILVIMKYITDMHKNWYNLELRIDIDVLKRVKSNNLTNVNFCV
jgi:hypothetical protein